VIREVKTRTEQLHSL